MKKNSFCGRLLALLISLTLVLGSVITPYVTHATEAIPAEDTTVDVLPADEEGGDGDAAAGDSIGENEGIAEENSAEETESTSEESESTSEENGDNAEEANAEADENNNAAEQTNESNAGDANTGNAAENDNAAEKNNENNASDTNSGNAAKNNNAAENNNESNTGDANSGNEDADKQPAPVNEAEYIKKQIGEAIALEAVLTEGEGSWSSAKAISKLDEKYELSQSELGGAQHAPVRGSGREADPAGQQRK